jgi:hypothetical protein
MGHRRRLIAAVIALTLGAAACAEAGTSSVADSPTSPSASPSVTPNGPKPTKTTVSPGVEVPELLDFEAQLLGGGTFRGADLAGKDVAIWFWAPW